MAFFATFKIIFDNEIKFCINKICSIKSIAIEFTELKSKYKFSVQWRPNLD